jgi:hypothetical protein
MARSGDFSAAVKNALAKRVAYRCCNPSCGATTVGPHLQAERSVNLGVAAHVMGASAGGPRYEVRQTAAERASIQNAIWLCQRCAKLVDSDVGAFPIQMLRRWKVRAEAAAPRALHGEDTGALCPRPTDFAHAPLPRLDGVLFATAREHLLRTGWQPVMSQWSYADDPRIAYGNGPYFWRRGIREIKDACPTGLAYCTFLYEDIYGSRLKVVTAGEIVGEQGEVYVWRWSLKMFSRSVAQSI